MTQVILYICSCFSIETFAGSALKSHKELIKLSNWEKAIKGCVWAIFEKCKSPVEYSKMTQHGSNLRATETEADTMFRLTGLVFLLLGSKRFSW